MPSASFRQMAGEYYGIVEIVVEETTIAIHDAEIEVYIDGSFVVAGHSILSFAQCP
jgi:hypothetical protein